MLKNWLRWQKGRQNTGYDKCLIFVSRWLKCDCYILRFNTGSAIPPHTDKIDSGRHFRLNIVLKHAKAGGQFHCEQMLFESNRVKLFRPDLHAHSVSLITDGTRYVLSLGCVRP